MFKKLESFINDSLNLVNLTTQNTSSFLLSKLDNGAVLNYKNKIVDLFKIDVDFNEYDIYSIKTIPKFNGDNDLIEFTFNHKNPDSYVILVSSVLTKLKSMNLYDIVESNLTLISGMFVISKENIFYYIL